MVYTARAAARRPYNARAPAKPARECVKNSRFCQGGIFLLQQFYNSWTFAVGYTARRVKFCVIVPIFCKMTHDRRPRGARESVKNSRFCQGGIFLLQQFYNS